MSEIKGQVSIPREYFFKMACADYESWQAALPREFFQNSIDAGASKIEVTFDDAARLVTVVDNGSGMSLQTLTEKLLVLGGSLKDSASAVGAFGKAKELLFFSWDRYEILTKDLRVVGVGAEYTITHTATQVGGTTCKIWLPDGSPLDYLKNSFTTVAGRMQTAAKIYVDGERCDGTLRRGTPVRTIENIGQIYQTKCRQNSYMAVRINGIWMFALYVGDGKGELVLELERSSLELLTSNRDGFKWPHGRDISKVVADLLINPDSALSKKKNIVKERIRGTGKVRVAAEAVDRARGVMETGSINDFRDAVKAMLLDLGQLQGLAKARANDLKQIAKTDDREALSLLSLAGYQPDFVLKYEDGQRKTVASFMSKPRASMLSKIWTETIRQVLLDNRISLEFSAGFVFDDDVEACIERVDGDVTIYVNPLKIGKISPRRILMGDLTMKAAHELSHLKVSEHNEAFVNELHRMMGETYKSDYCYIKIGKIKASDEYRGR
jgi:hypothetical protein